MHVDLLIKAIHTIAMRIAKAAGGSKDRDDEDLGEVT